MAEKSDPIGYPTVSTRMDFTELDILDLDLDLDLIFRPERVWIWILGITYRNPARNPNPIRTRSKPEKNPNNIYYL